jgi:hypothetical protein
MPPRELHEVGTRSMGGREERGGEPIPISTKLEWLNGQGGKTGMNRNRAPVSTPVAKIHDPMELEDGMTKFCAKCGRILAYRAARNAPWISSGARSRGCDWGG